MRWQQTMRHGDRSRSRSEIPRIPALCRMGEWRFSFEGVSGIVRHAVFTISHQFSHQSLAPGKALDRTRSGRFGGVILALGATGKPSAGPRPSGPCVSLDSSPSAGAVTSSSETRRSLSRGEACDLPGHVVTKTKRRSRKHSKHPRARGREEEGAPSRSAQRPRGPHVCGAASCLGAECATRTSIRNARVSVRDVAASADPPAPVARRWADASPLGRDPQRATRGRAGV